MYRIKEFSQRTGVSSEAIRYYERVGVLPAARRAENGYRIYSDDDVEHLNFISRARSLDFSLDEIKEIVALREGGEAQCLYVINQINTNIKEIDHKIAELTRLKTELLELQAEANRLPLAEIDAKSCVCHLIENQQIAAKDIS